jgi:methyl-accepting chemotaxis protein
VIYRLRRAARNAWAPASRRYLAQLTPTIADLEDLNRSTEQDFLAVGGKLHEFSAAARQISNGMAALSELISGARGRNVSEVLARVLEQLNQTEARLGATRQTLARVLEEARRIEGVFGDFRVTVAQCRVLGSLTRIETARLGNAGAGFGHLAEEVKTLTESIESGGQRVLEGSAVLRLRIQSSIARISGIRDGAIQGLPALLAEAHAGMESLEQTERQAREASLRQSAGYAEVSAAVEDLVGALQFHDITRQKIAHVADALRSLGSDSQTLPKGRSPAGEAQMVLTLQSAQLADAERVFGASVVRIEEDLDGIARRVTEMTGECGSLLEPPSGERGSFFLSLEGHFNAILEILGACVRAEVETKELLGGLAQDVARMRDSVAEVAEIGISLRRMAINATIRADHIGAAGRALDVLAGVMQRLGSESNTMTNEGIAALEAMTEAASAASADAGSDPNHVVGDEFLVEVRRTILQLRESSDIGHHRLSQIAGLGSDLRDGIQSVRGGFSAGRAVAETVRHALSALADVAVENGFALSAGERPPEISLQDFARHYTMESERAVHQNIAGREEAPAPETAMVAAAVAEGNDLGDNVELF